MADGLFFLDFSSACWHNAGVGCF